MTCLELNDDELGEVIKSLSITSDALVAKIARLEPGRRHSAAVREYQVVDRVIERARGLQRKRVS